MRHIQAQCPGPIHASRIARVRTERHASYLVNPAYVTGVSRFQAELGDGGALPIPEKRYTAVRALLERGMGRKSRPGEPA